MSGYLPPSAFVHDEQVEVLDLAGKLVSVQMSEVKWICFVRDFQSGDANQPERLLRKTFVTRPRSQGLWIRARLKDNDLIEGLAQNDTTLLDGRWAVPHSAGYPIEHPADLSAAAGSDGAGCAGGDQDGKRGEGPSEVVQESLFKPQNSI